MTDAPRPHASNDLSVVDAWRILVKPAPTRPAASYVGLVTVIGLLNLSAIAAVVGASVLDPSVAVIAALLHTGLIPGLLLAFAAVPRDEVDLAEWLVLALGFGMLVLMVGGLTLALLPVRFSPIVVVGWTATVTLVLAAFAFRRGISWRMPRPGSRGSMLGALAVLLVAAALRLPGLGYSEFQGDETEVILRTTGVVQNLPDAIFYHGKGPGEIVVVALQYGLVGNLGEDAARLPFALAGIGGVLAFYVLARRLLGAPAALAAGLLMATNGYLVAFSRIAQYQSLVLLLGMLGLWCTIRWSQGGSSIWPALAGALMASAALAHYDALFFLPPIVLAAFWRLRPRDLIDHDALGPWIRGAQVGGAILALFFLPYFESPLFSLATDRIEDRVGAGFPYNNLPGIVASATLYLGTALPVLVANLIAIGVLAALIRRPGGAPLRVWLLALVWTLVPFLFYAFVARKPGTHVHVATSGLVLLAAAGFGNLWALLCNLTPPTRRGEVHPVPACLLVGLLAAGVAVVISYLVPVYLQTTDELVRDDHVDRLPLAWTPPDGLPTDERFGFPYQAGWKAVGTLFADGTLQGSYDSNEQPQVTHWYTRGAWRCSIQPRYFLLAENVQEETEISERTVNAEYRQIGTVTVAGEQKLRIYERLTGERRSANGRPTAWAVEDFSEQFERYVSTPTLDPGPWARGVLGREAVPLANTFADEIELRGYHVYAENPVPGGVVRVDLSWLPRVSSDERHRIDVQLGREPRIGDGGGPGCDETGAEKEWQANRPFVQRVSIPIAPAAEPGRYPLLVSVSRLDGSGALLPTGAGASDDMLLEIGQVEVSAR